MECYGSKCYSILLKKRVRHKILFFPRHLHTSMDRYNMALVCHRWRYLACHPRHWLRIERSIKSLAEPGVYLTLEAAISDARPGDTILIASGGNHIVGNIQITKPLCLMGGGKLPDDTILTCLRGSESAFEFLSTCKVANLTVRAELGCCLLHRSGRLIVEACILQCEENPLDYLSFPIVSTAPGCTPFAQLPLKEDSVVVSNTRIEGGAKAVSTNGNLVLQHVRAMYARTSIFFWFEVGEKVRVSL
ncbi:F-box protein SKIP5 [Platanthera zijinensis]|uniref:F-box protein SKIP5 n=1 Tax=Platanthera zijinensis TaxID=2320716 RepID=A0AAP0G003_9ASPA